MRIPLDYYRILGLPPQATLEQLQQAHHDRALQLPRREYSEAAIAGRKALLDEAYAVLADPEQRRLYDARLRGQSVDVAVDVAPERAKGQVVSADPDQAKSTPELLNGAELPKPIATPPEPIPEPPLPVPPPLLEVKPEQVPGALLILYELGEYDLILKLARPQLTTWRNRSQDGAETPDLARSDIILTLALAYLELGREYWQQGQYERAADVLQSGQTLLLQEGVFAGVRGEIQADLYKLRPYRILELLALPETNTSERQQGLQLLQDMLNERGGIDGTGDDHSGLTVDDFLRFIQQIRDYLTAAEQQALFEAEARRPSAVATYLAVYTLIARGFAQFQPALIHQAKQLLLRLSVRQDVHLEQAICALLLGQTEEASRALELSQEYESIAFIRDHSQGSPDLLPGLCLYSERWLQEEVFPHFRDLANEVAQLKAYFANEEVQAYLEALPNEREVEADTWTPITTDLTPPPYERGDEQATGRLSPPAPSTTAVAWEDPTLPPLADPPHPTASSPPSPVLPPHPTRQSRRTAASPTPVEPAASGMTAAAGPAQPNPKVRRFARSVTEPLSRFTQAAVSPTVSQNSSSSHQEYAIRDESVSSRRSSPRAGTTHAIPRLGRLLLVGLLGLGLLGGTVFLVRATYGWLTGIFRALSGPQLVRESAEVPLDSPLFILPEPGSAAFRPSMEGPMNKELATWLIETWLATKAAALGPKHATDKLATILAEPALGQWQQQADGAKRDNWHGEYEHTVRVETVTQDPNNPDQAEVEAQVQERAAFYQNGRLDEASSYQDTLRVRYSLVRQGGEWRIQSMQVVG
ncbi:IMS domain-containing protein [Trichothermofontia sichuanensis B231]|uniref:IMS domain-containing protein n=1 Tax=Trichothermofontia sichuanensis TaxID=3045816 RepID=UPI0022458439|nr:IMS domain-containing protein [Trichothermofontia sichuanensis]UZQ53126.1 IMS domain-containing protein [Trichothermofontia sichuanensis B231]